MAAWRGEQAAVYSRGSTLTGSMAAGFGAAGYVAAASSPLGCERRPSPPYPHPPQRGKIHYYGGQAPCRSQHHGRSRAGPHFCHDG
ncbi:unnamed protein product [Urochloa humidicola]